MRSLLVILALVSACGAPRHGGTSAPPDAAGAGVLPTPKLAVGDRFALTLTMGMDQEVSREGQTLLLKMEERSAGEATVTEAGDGRARRVAIRVTSAEAIHYVDGEPRVSTLASIGREYEVIDQPGDARSLVRRPGGDAIAGKEADVPRRLANLLFPARTEAVRVPVGGTVPADALIDPPGEGGRLEGTFTLGAATAACAAPFTGRFAGRHVEDDATMEVDMAGTLCGDPSLGLLVGERLEGTLRIEGPQLGGQGGLTTTHSVRKL
ncbi:MAG: hypothetical protein ACK4YP_25890 [Myxococcota bacterium]